MNHVPFRILVLFLFMNLVTYAQDNGIYIAFAEANNIKDCTSYETNFLDYVILSGPDADSMKADAAIKAKVKGASRYNVTFNGPYFENNYVIILVGTTDYKTNTGKCQRNVMKFAFGKIREETLSKAIKDFNSFYRGWGADRTKAPIYRIVADGRY